MRIRGRTASYLTFAAMVLATTAAVPASVADATSKPAVAVRTITHVRGGVITKISYPDGTVVKVFSDGPMHEAAPVNRTAARIVNGATTSQQSLSGLLMPDKPGVVGAAKLTQQPSAALAPYDELIALGVSQKDAAPFLNLQPPSSTTAVQTAMRTAVQTATTTSSAGLPQLWNTRCVDVDFDGSSGHLYGCDRQYKIWVNPNDGSDWYMQDQHLATATMHDGGFNPDEVTGLKFGMAYSANNQIVNWNPISTKDMGSCVTTTASVEAKGVGISSTSTECPETWGVFYIGPLNFTTKWDGQGSGPSNGARATHGVASVHNPPNASTDRGTPWTVWWD